MILDRKIPIPIFIIVFIQLVVIIGYAIYYGYIGLNWGFNQRFLSYMFFDSIFLFFILIAIIGLLYQKGWSWWMAIILFTKLSLAKVISYTAAIQTGQFEDIVNSLSGVNIFYDVIILFAFLTGVILLSLPIIRKTYQVKMSGGQLIFFVGIGAVILYMLYFILMIIIT